MKKYNSQRGRPVARRRRKKRRRLLRTALPFCMITGAVILSLLIIKSDFIASPEYTFSEKVGSGDIELLLAYEEGRSIVSPYEGEDRDFKGSGKTVGDKYLILVNQYDKLTKDYKPDNLVDIRKQVNALDRPILMEKTAAEAFKEMMGEMESAAEKDKRIETLIAVSGYRTYEYQEELFAKEVKKNMELMSRERAEKEAARLVALPGSSEHQTGLAIDVTTESMYYRLQESFEHTHCYRWLEENCADFGFIIRYPKDKSDITGISYEPWHLRYVGEEHASIIMREGLALEEYLER